MEILGLPLHPLVVHGAVVLVPLAAVGGVAIAAVKWARIRYGWLVVIGSFVAGVTTFVAQRAGEDFMTDQRFRRPTAEMQQHFALGDDLLIWTILLFVGSLVVMIAQRMIDQQNPRGRIALIAGSVVTVVSGLVSLVQVVRIGHSGANAVWGSG